MSNCNPTNYNGSLVQKYISTSYDTVLTVANNLADIKLVAENLDNLTPLADNYLGAQAENPTVRSNGDPLQDGDLYFNSTDNTLRTYTDGQWVAINSVGTPVLNTYTGTGVQTSFTLSSTPSDIKNTQVYINGLYQTKDSYSLNGNVITFNTPPANGAIIEFNMLTLTSFASATSSEIIALTSGQKVVTYTNEITGAAFYLAGPDIDRGRLIFGTDYTANYATNTITLTESYPAGTLCVLVYGYDEEISVELSPFQDTLNTKQASAYTASETGAVATTVTAKLDTRLSVKDFGATGNGATDDTAAIQAALATGKEIYFPKGNYVVTSTLNVTQPIYGTGSSNTQTRLTLSNSGKLNLNGESARVSDMILQSSTAGIPFITVATSYARISQVKLIALGGATGQVGIKFDCSSVECNNNTVTNCDFSLTTAIQITGTFGFKNNSIVTNSYSNFISAIDISTTGSVINNYFNGYFETGTNCITRSTNTFTANHIKVATSGVTYVFNNTASLSTKNVWELEGPTFAFNGTKPSNQIFIGLETTKCRATTATLQAIPHNVPTTVIFDTEEYDVLNEFNPATGVFTATYAGYYQFNGSVMSASAAWDGTEYWEASLYKNGTIYARGHRAVMAATQTTTYLSQVTASMYLAAGDTIDMRIFQNSGDPVNITADASGTFLSVAQIA